MDFLNQLQWLAIIVTVVAAWLIASQAKRKRNTGFWIVWGGWSDHAYALVVLQIALAILNIRGTYKNELK